MKQVNISQLIIALVRLLSKGIKTIEIDGTLMCEADGNNIIATNKPQM